MNPMSRSGWFAGILALASAHPDQASAQTDADRNFQARCNAPGVVKCLGFDNASGISLMGDARIDNDMKASGAGSMRVDIASSAGESPGNMVTKLGRDFGEGSSLYMQWRQRFSPEMIDTDLGGEGFKQFVIYDGTPCGPNMEVAMLNQDYGGFPIFYSACGNTYFRKSLSGGEYALMWDKDGTICTNRDPGRCVRYQADQWMTFSYEQKIGQWGQANSVVRVSMAEEGKPLKVIIELPDFTFKSDKAGSAYRDLWVGPFSLGRKANSNYPAAKTWFDEFIISTEPIADPHQAASGLRAPAPGAVPDGPDVRFQSSGPRIAVSFPGSNPGADIDIYDRRGRKVKGVSGVEGAGWEWNAAGTGAGVYLVRVRAGSRIFTGKVSVLE